MPNKILVLLGIWFVKFLFLLRIGLMQLSKFGLPSIQATAYKFKQ